MKRKALATILFVLCLSLCFVFTSCFGGSTDNSQGGSNQNKNESEAVSSSEDVTDSNDEISDVTTSSSDEDEGADESEGIVTSSSNEEAEDEKEDVTTSSSENDTDSEDESTTESSNEDIDTPVDSEKPNIYEVSFDSNGGSDVEAVEVEENNKVEAPEIPTRKGYTFDGWYLGEDKWSFNNAVTESITLVAKWIPNVNKIAFSANGGEGTMDSITGETHSTLTLPICTFERTGYHFVGWSLSPDGEVDYEDGAQHKMGALKNYIFFAIWEENENSLILFANDGTEEQYEVLAKSGEKLNLPKTSFQKAGYTLIGWAYESDGEIAFGAETEYTMGTEPECVLFAIWQINENDIVLDMNDGTDTTETFKLNSFDSMVLPTNDYTRDGYTFAGWSFTKDGDIALLDGDTYESGADSTVTLYAVWSAVKYTIKYNDATELEKTEVTYTIEDLPFKLPILKNSSVRMFDLWHINQDLSDVGMIKITELGDYELYPSYVAATDGLVLVDIDGEWTVAGYKGSATSVLIPDSLRGMPVTSVGDNAFKGNHYLSDVTLPSQLKSIGDAAFLSCSGLSYIELPSTLTAIGKQAFSYSGITNLSIPVGVTDLGQYAFYQCYELKTIKIPEGVTKIDYEAFYDCTALVNVELPNSLEFIAEDAFRNCEALVSITLPPNVTTIGKRAFYGCDILETISLPNSVSSMGDEVFGFCKKLKVINIPTGITRINDLTFNNCYALKDVVIPENVKVIGNSAFAECRTLESISIPNKVTSIGASAFYNCFSLVSVEMSSKTETIDEKAFYNCEKLENISIPRGVISIGDSAFAYCESVITIFIPNTVKSIGDNAFRKCDQLYIYCEADEKPTGWSETWNPSNRVVLWGRDE